MGGAAQGYCGRRAEGARIGERVKDFRALGAEGCTFSRARGLADTDRARERLKPDNGSAPRPRSRAPSPGARAPKGG